MTEILNCSKYIILYFFHVFPQVFIKVKAYRNRNYTSFIDIIRLKKFIILVFQYTEPLTNSFN